MSFSDFAGTPFEPYVLPIIPAGAGHLLSPRSKLIPDDLGKIPGMRYQEGWGGFPKWQDSWQHNQRSSPKLLATYASWYKKDGFEEVIAVSARLLLGLDIDTPDPVYADVAEKVADEVFGPAPRRTRPNSGKLLRCYRLDQKNSPPIPKVRKMWRPPDGGKQFAIEMLGEGQQWLCEGPHVSGMHYEWSFGITPIVWGWDNLTLITLDQVFLFFKRVEEELAKLDCVVVKGSGNVRLSGFESAPRTAVGLDHVDLCPDLDMLRDLLTNYLPVMHVEFATYDAWATACIAIVTACGKNEEFYPVFEEWALGDPRNDEDMIRGKWESVRESSIGWGYLCQIAHEYGYTADTQLMFDPLDEMEDHQSTASLEGPQQQGPRRGPIPKLLPADFDVRKLPRRQFVLGRRFIAGAVTVGVGAPGAGKSNLAIVSALAIAAGQPLTSEPVYRTGPVWIHNNEESMEELQRRIGGMLQCHGIDVASVRENIFVSSGLDEPLIVAIKHKDIVGRTQAVADVIAAIKENGIVHIVIDPFVSIHRGVSENSNEEIEQVADALRHIAHETGCSIDLVHHSLKSHRGNTEVHAGDMNAARGASSLIAAARIVYTLSPMSKKTAQEMHIDRAEAARLVRLDQGKGNYTARDTNERWFELEPFNIRNGGAGTDDLFVVDGDTIAVPKPWEPSNLATEEMTQAEDREAKREAKLQRVRDIVARAMQSERSEISKVRGSIEHEFCIKKSAANDLIKAAIPEGEEVTAEVSGRRCLLTIERQLPSPPGRLFIIRKPCEGYSEAA